MKRYFTQSWEFVKQHPWETATVVLGTLLVAQTINANKIARVANINTAMLETANKAFDDIAEAVRNGWSFQIDEGTNFIDIIVPEVTV